MELKIQNNVKFFLCREAERALLLLEESRAERIDLTRMLFASKQEAQTFFYYVCRLLQIRRPPLKHLSLAIASRLKQPPGRLFSSFPMLADHLRVFPEKYPWLCAGLRSLVLQNVEWEPTQENADLL